jgi:hypothetical protein
MCDEAGRWSICELEGERLEVAAGDRVSHRPTGNASLEGFTLASGVTEGIAIDSLEPGTTVSVNTRNSRYRFLILHQPGLVLVKGGAMFPEAKVVRLEGATAGGSALKMAGYSSAFRSKCGSAQCGFDRRAPARCRLRACRPWARATTCRSTEFRCGGWISSKTASAIVRSTCRCDSTSTACWATARASRCRRCSSGSASRRRTKRSSTSSRTCRGSPRSCGGVCAPWSRSAPGF